MHHPASLLALVLALGAALCAQADPPSVVDEAGVTAALDALFAPSVTADTPGCAVGIARHGRVLFVKGYGRASLEHEAANTPRTVFNIGSMSKQFTAFAVLLAEQRGQLSLDDDVRRHVPELRDHGTPIRVRDLLQHSSGLRDVGTLERLTAWPVNTRGDLLDLLARQRGLNFVPGTRHEYSHSDYELLGLLIERATGEPLAELLQREVFTPLGMTSTRVQDGRMAPIPGRATACSRREDGWRMRLPDSQLVGGSNVWTSVEDLLRWMHNFETAEVGGRELVDRLTSRPTLASGETIPYAFGLWLGEHRGLRTVYRRGGAGGFSTGMVRYPDHGLSVVTLCNSRPRTPASVNRALAELYLGDVMEPAPAAEDLTVVPAPPDELERLAGWYRTPAEPWQVLQFVVRDGVLCDVGDAEVYRLERLADGRYRDQNLRYSFTTAVDGRPQRLTLTWEDGREELERRPGDTLWAPTATELTAYAGRFASEDLGLVWELGVADGALVLRRPRASAARALPVDPDLFRVVVGDADEPMEAGLRFARDAAGRITGFGVTAIPDPFEVVRDLRFERIDAR